MIRFLIHGFAGWLLLGVLLAWWYPHGFTWCLPYNSLLLGLIMLGMGITLRWEDFRDALEMRWVLVVAAAAQFIVMPLLGWSLASGLQLPTELAVGLILVACCPGGTASNVIAHLAGAHVPLSVMMTALSTLLAVVATPLLTQLYAGAWVAVPVLSMLKDMFLVVVLPICLGLLLNRVLRRQLRWVVEISPVISVILIVLIVGAIIGKRRADIEAAPWVLLLAVIGLHAGGFFLGRMIGKWLRFSPAAGRTLSIEVGMQNSGLGVTLAVANFSAAPLTAVPAALSAVVHSLIGSALASIWRARRGR